MKKYDYAVVIGRFQPLHNEHIKLLQKAQNTAHNLIVLLGSATSARTAKNPFTADERRAMIWQAIKDRPLQNGASILNLRDFYYSDNLWAAEVQRLVYSIASPSDKICVVGGGKDDTYYLRMFPQWGLESYQITSELNATQIRDRMFLKTDTANVGAPLHVQTFMRNFQTGPSFERLKEEFEYYKDYPKQWGPGPFVTTDAVVTCGGHVLLIERGDCPGKGLQALPGGFLGLKEKIEDGMIRELKEETNIKVPVPVLKGSIAGSRVFDHPFRSQRGRVITHAFHIDLKDASLPKVKAASDAKKAWWAELSWVTANPHLFFEDHYAMIECMISGGSK
jgi:bifunctional NMN adenylyltransferase/nudix hydrolase